MKTIESPVSGVVQQYLVKVGDSIVEGQEIAIVDSMKMEIPVASEVAGTVMQMCHEPGTAISEGAALLKVS